MWCSLCSVDLRLTTSRRGSRTLSVAQRVRVQRVTACALTTWWILVASRNLAKGSSRLAAAIAARIERGHLEDNTHCGWHRVEGNHVDSRGTGTDGSGHPAVERTSTAAIDGGEDTHKRWRKPCTASAELDRHARTARAARQNLTATSTSTQGQRFGVRAGGVDTRRQARPVRRRSDEVRGLVVQTEIVPRSRGPAVSARVDDDIDTKTQRARQRRKRTRHTDVPHTRDDNCRSRVRQVSQRRRERRVRGLEAVRDGVGEPKPRTRYVGLLMNVLGCKFRDDVPTKRSRELCTTTRTNPQRP